MKKPWLVILHFALSILVLFDASNAQTTSPSSPDRNSTTINKASGTFDVKLNPLPAYNQEDKNIGRMSSDKQFHGDLEGTSKGEMLNFARSAYVAIEKVSGSLKGRAGTFALQHSGTMDHGKPQLMIMVVPDSGTGQLTGLAGTMNIMIAPDGKHSYDFSYTLPQ
ncbi:MAG TPA: DUF3224 domain-containing protein [Terriglobales bacterium]|nr:DUF3224 domain-containing protein [Terriglobales bacterium]